MNDNDEKNPLGIQTTPLTEEQQALFQRLAEVSRKAIEDLVSNVANSIAPTGLDAFYQKYAVLMGMGTANVTLLVGLLDACGMENDPNLLATIVNQMSDVWNQIQERKATGETVQ